jgi:hypothetical protein
LKLFQIGNFSIWNISEMQISERRFLLLTWATIKLEEADWNPPKDAVGTRRASPKFLLTSVKHALQWCTAMQRQPIRSLKMSNVTVRVEDDKEGCAMFITTNAAQRRAILANAHAKYFASHRTGDDSLAVARALTAANVISSTDRIVEITFEGTTLVVHIDYDKELEAIEIDAYGNTVRGTV